MRKRATVVGSQHDISTAVTFRWLDRVRQICSKKTIELLTIDTHTAVMTLRTKVEDEWSDNDVERLLVYYGHGSENFGFAGPGPNVDRWSEFLWIDKVNIHRLKNCHVFSTACNAGREFGASAVENGCKVLVAPAGPFGIFTEKMPSYDDLNREIGLAINVWCEEVVERGSSWNDAKNAVSNRMAGCLEKVCSNGSLSNQHLKLAMWVFAINADFGIHGAGDCVFQWDE